MSHYVYHDNIRNHAALRHSFSALSQSIFELDFEPWYQQGYWQDAYRPHVLVHQDTVVANVSLSLIHTEHQGLAKCYGQIGTVMTHPDHRHQGLAATLMARVMAKYLPVCDALYLYANGTVLDFYPRYGFVPAQEYQHSVCVQPLSSARRRLRMDQPADVALLQQHFEQGNRYAELPLRQNWGLLMFYCGQFLSDCVYYLPELNVVAIFAEEDEQYLLYDVFGHSDADLSRIMAALVSEDKQKVALGFSPKDNSGFWVNPYAEEDTHLFVYAGLDNPFAQAQLTMPALSHA
ncbi:MAG: GNAT family N-acetyltransferase [Neisseriaceae bacterium]|nr:GNAT family N-acetyltransferase [Neisseriaceae bacterium]MBP6861767.1 GNAT family N-acetyltransferase [Neisseriaceae bacterium]